MKNHRYLLLFSLACMALLLVSCYTTTETITRFMAPVIGTAKEKLGALLSNGQITKEVHILLVALVDELAGALAKAISDATKETDIYGQKILEYGGILVASVLGTTGLSRVRRGAVLLTGRKREGQS